MTNAYLHGAVLSASAAQPRGLHLLLLMLSVNLCPARHATALKHRDGARAPAVLVAAGGQGDGVNVEVDVQVGQVEVQSVPERASLSRERAAAGTATSPHSNSCNCRRAACLPGQQ